MRDRAEHPAMRQGLQTTGRCVRPTWWSPETKPSIRCESLADAEHRRAT